MLNRRGGVTPKINIFKIGANPSFLIEDGCAAREEYEPLEEGLVCLAKLRRSWPIYSKEAV